MSVPPEVIQQQMAAVQGGGAPPGGAPGAGAGTPGGMPGGMPAGAPGAKPAGPAAAPMNKPQDKEGLKAAAQTNIHIATNMLEEALPAFGAESKEGQKILKALSMLGPLMAKRDSSDLVPAEVLKMVRGLPQMGGGTDIQRMLLQQMQGKNPPQQQQQPQQPPNAA